MWQLKNDAVVLYYIYILNGMEKERLAFRDYMLFVEAWCLLALARGMLVFVPFKRIVLFMRHKRVTEIPDDKRSIILTGIQVAITRACVRSPWRTMCFEQALAAKMMTRRRGLRSVIYFGVKKEADNDKIQAHAWLKVGEFVVTGWQRMNSYKVVAEF
jgi:hypothetical protein